MELQAMLVLLLVWTGPPESGQLSVTPMPSLEACEAAGGAATKWAADQAGGQPVRFTCIQVPA